MKKVAFTSFIAVFIVGLASSTFAANFSILLGTWEVTEKNYPSLANLEPIETHATWTFTESSEVSAIGYVAYANGTTKNFIVTWDSYKNRFGMMIEDDPLNTIYVFSVLGDKFDNIIGTYESQIEDGTVNGIKSGVLCPDTVPSFDLNNFTLSLPFICIEGNVYNTVIKIRLKSDGTWEIVQ